MTYDDLDAWAASREPYAQACYVAAVDDHDSDAVVHTTLKSDGSTSTVILKPGDYARLPSYPETFPPPPGHFVFAVRSGPMIVFHHIAIPKPGVRAAYRSPAAVN